jgi:fructose-1,6-bisphosphatase I
MQKGAGLDVLLRSAASASAPVNATATEAILHMAEAAATLSDMIARPPLNGRLGASAGTSNADGDGQRHLDLAAENLFSAALRKAGIGGYLSEEAEGAAVFDPSGSVAVAIDPLDGSSNIDVNAPIGTIFSILPMVSGAGGDPLASFLQPGRRQVAAGFFVYGPQTSLVLSVGQGTHLFVLDRATGRFVLVEAKLKIPLSVPEYAINASNYRHWHEPVQSYIDDCVMGADGPRGRNFNMRWIASLVADAYRIFTRGGIFLYPADKRDGYGQGRLRLVYEANPVAFLAEQAGGAASDGIDPILDLLPESAHQRTPFVMGSADKVERVRRYHTDRFPPSRDEPLFGRRGLLRA